MSSSTTTTTTDSTHHHHIESKWKEEVKKLAEENAKLLSALRSVTSKKNSEIDQLKLDSQQSKEELKNCKVQLQVVQEEVTQLRQNGGGGGGGSSSTQAQEEVNTLRTELLEVKDKLDDSVNHSQNLQTENSRLKMQVKQAQQQARTGQEEVLHLKQQLDETTAELEETQNQLQQSLANTATIQQQQQQQQHVDPNDEGTQQNNENENSIDKLEAEMIELREQRDYFMKEVDKINHNVSRDVSELQNWATLLKKMIQPLRQVRSKWDGDTEGGQSESIKELSEVLQVNTSQEDSYFIVDNLSRVSAQVKKSKDQTSQLLSSSMNQQNLVDVDNFSMHMKPTVVEFLKLAHGCFCDCAYLWAMVRKYKQLEQEWSKKEQELTQKKKGWF